MPFQIIRDDITKVRADAIVNTANPEPIYASGTDAAIYHAAGADALLAERKKIGYIEPGEVAVTAAFALPARFIIHTVGPAWMDGDHGEYELLASCYRKSLLIARQLGCESIAFPLISTGVYGFPKDRALSIALHEISAFLEDTEMDVTLVVFDRKAFDISSTLVAEVGQYIDENYVAARRAEEYYGTYAREGYPEAFELEEYPEAFAFEDYPDAYTCKESQEEHPCEEVQGAYSYSGAFPEERHGTDASRDDLPEEKEFRMRRSRRSNLSRRLRDVERPGKRRGLTGALRDTFLNRRESGKKEQSLPPAAEEALPEESPVFYTETSPSEPYYLETESEMPSPPIAGASIPGLAPAEAAPAAPAPAAPAVSVPSAPAASAPSAFAPAAPSASVPSAPAAGTDTATKKRSLQDVVSNVGETFQECLLRMIDERGFTDAQVYKRANIDRKLFSKIRCNPGYIPRRKTVISLAVALELNLDETTDLLRKAGIALSPGSKFDLIIRYCLENRIYDTMEINAILFDYDQPQLGA